MNVLDKILSDQDSDISDWDDENNFINAPLLVDNTTADINNMDIVFKDYVILQGILQEEKDVIENSELESNEELALLDVKARITMKTTIWTQNTTYWL